MKKIALICLKISIVALISLYILNEIYTIALTYLTIQLFVILTITSILLMIISTILMIIELSKGYKLYIITLGIHYLFKLIIYIGTDYHSSLSNEKVLITAGISGYLYLFIQKKIKTT